MKTVFVVISNFTHTAWNCEKIVGIPYTYMISKRVKQYLLTLTGSSTQPTLHHFRISLKRGQMHSGKFQEGTNPNPKGGGGNHISNILKVTCNCQGGEDKSTPWPPPPRNKSWLANNIKHLSNVNSHISCENISYVGRQLAVKPHLY